MDYKILLVDDHLVVKAGVSIILNNEISDLAICYASDYLETISLIKINKYILTFCRFTSVYMTNNQIIDRYYLVLCRCIRQTTEFGCDYRHHLSNTNWLSRLRAIFV